MMVSWKANQAVNFLCLPTTESYEIWFQAKIKGVRNKEPSQVLDM